MPNVLHICPTYFSPDSFVAGGERYSLGLASAMAKRVPTTLLTFGDKKFERHVDGLTIRCAKRLAYVYHQRANPLSFAVFNEVRKADIVHCHQFKTVVTDLAILAGFAFRKRVFVTDLGGSAGFSLSYHLPLYKGLTSFLMISQYNSELWKLPLTSHVIYGGVDTARFHPPDQNYKRSSSVLYVGRLQHNKGIDELIYAASDMEAVAIGQPENSGELARLTAACEGKRIRLETDVADDELVVRYRDAAVTVIPTFVDGGYTTALESMASGTPVVAYAVGSLPELIEDGVSGFLVPEGDRKMLRARLQDIVDHPERRAEMGARARERVLSLFTWDKVVDRCLAAYTAPAGVN